MEDGSLKLFVGSFMNKGFNRPFVLVEEMTRELLKAERQSYEKGNKDDVA